MNNTTEGSESQSSNLHESAAPSTANEEAESSATSAAGGRYTAPLPDSGDASGGSVDPVVAQITDAQIQQELDERKQDARHRDHFVSLALGIVITFYGALLVAISIGNGQPEVKASFSTLSVLKVTLLTDGPTHVYLTKLGILAAIPTAILIRLAGMVRKESKADKDEKKKVEDVPVASVAVATEALKAIAEVGKSFAGKG